MWNSSTVAPLTRAPVSLAAVAHPWRRAQVGRATVGGPALAGPAFSPGGQRRLARGFTQFPLYPDRPAGRIQHFEQAIVGQLGDRIDRGVAKPVANQLSSL